MPFAASSSPDPSRSPSRATNHLANERTFLAWVRTALGLMGLGFVLARMGLFLQQMTLFGGHATQRNARSGHEFMVTGVVFLLFGTALGGWTGWVYESTRRAIEVDRYEPARSTVLALTVVVVMVGMLIVGLVLWQTLAQE